MTPGPGGRRRVDRSSPSAMTGPEKWPLRGEGPTCKAQAGTTPRDRTRLMRPRRFQMRASGKPGARGRFCRALWWPGTPCRPLRPLRSPRGHAGGTRHIITRDSRRDTPVGPAALRSSCFVPPSLLPTHIPQTTRSETRRCPAPRSPAHHQSLREHPAQTKRRGRQKCWGPSLVRVLWNGLDMGRGYAAHPPCLAVDGATVDAAEKDRHAAGRVIGHRVARARRDVLLDGP